jgi:GT2 family glycosyltransferase
MKSKVNINILTWNGEKYLKPCLDSALAQDYPNFSILIIDNASKDGTEKIIRDYLHRTKKDTEHTQKITYIKNKKNIGFAAGHNQGIRETDGKYVMLLNQDAILKPNFLTEAIKILEKDKKIATIQPKVLKYDFKKKKPKNIFDTTGLLMLKNRRIINRGQGEKNKGQFNLQEGIFGADGAVPIYRRKALEDVKLPIFNFSAQGGPASGWQFSIFKNRQKFEYFDESFFAYKEDVDLAWRLRLYGWRAVYAPNVIAYHERGAGESASRKAIDILKERKKISLFAKTISFKNQRLMQIKNEFICLYLKHLPWILWKEIRAWGYIILFEPRILKVLPQMFRQMPKAWKQRKIIIREKRVKAGETEKWFV